MNVRSISLSLYVLIFFIPLFGLFLIFSLLIWLTFLK